MFNLTKHALHLTVFADERKNIENKWDYIAILIVPTSEIINILDEIRQSRDKANYYREMKFSELNKRTTKGDKFNLADLWVNIIMNSARERKRKLYFKIMGIDKDKIDHSFFGDYNTPTGKYATVYNRFFRTALLGALKYFFPDSSIVVNNIIHDNEGHLEQHGYFDWHCISKISRSEQKINFDCDKVRFVHSDHLREKNFPNDSHFIQLTDIFLGAATYCIHFTNPSNKSQYSISKKIFPLVDRIIREPRNKNSSFGYYRKYDICHFPDKPLKSFDGRLYPGSIYKLKTTNFQDHISGQLKLL